MKTLKYVAYILVFVATCLLFSYIFISVIDEEVISKIEDNLGDNIGDFLSGTVGIVLAFVSTIFLFLTFNAQQIQSKETKDDAFRTRFEGTFFNMLSMYLNSATLL